MFAVDLMQKQRQNACTRRIRAGRLERKEKPMLLPRPRGMLLESVKPGPRTVWPLSVYSVLAEFAPANGPASRARGGVIGLGGSQVSRQERPATWWTQEGTPESRQEMPFRIFVHSPSRLFSVQSHRLRDTPRPPTRASLIHPPHPRWWERGMRQEPSWLPSPSNLASVWRPQRVDGISIARQTSSWTSSFPLIFSRRRYPSPR